MSPEPIHLPVSPFRPSRRSRSVRARRLLLGSLAIVASAIAAIAPSPAAAGSYKVYSCATPDGRPAPIDGWWSSNSMHYSDPFDYCPQGNGFGVFMGNPPGAPNHSWQAGQHGSWQLTVPGDRYSVTKVHTVDLYRSVQIGNGLGADTGSAHPFSWISTTSGVLVDSCAAVYGCAGLGHPDAGNDGGNRIVVGDQVRLVAGCGGDSGRCAPSSIWSKRVITKIHRAVITVVDDDRPQLQLGGGTVLGSEPLRGTKTLQLAGSDRGAGVYEAVVTIGGVEVARRVLDDNKGKCVDAGSDPSNRFEFVYFEPCLALADASLSIDTMRAPEGAQTLAVTLADAAGNVTALERSVTIDNVAPPAATAPPLLDIPATADPRPGDVVTTTEGSWSGTDVRTTIRWQRGDGSVWSDISGAKGASYTLTKADINSRVRSVVTGRNSEGGAEAASGATPMVRSGATLVGQTVEPSPGDGSTNGAGGDANSGQLVVDREQRSVEVPYGAKIVVTGRLVDGGGRALADAEVDVYEQIVTTAAPWAKVATIKTDAQGGYAYRPKTTASRRLRFAYAARRGAADYHATRDILVSVKAKMTARATRRVVRSGDLIRLRGRITLEGLPKAGSWAEVQVLDAGVWRTIGARRVSSRGLWTFKHRLRRSRGVTFRFRALLRAAGDVPASESKSPTVKVRVR